MLFRSRCAARMAAGVPKGVMGALGNHNLGLAFNEGASFYAALPPACGQHRNSCRRLGAQAARLRHRNGNCHEQFGIAAAPRVPGGGGHAPSSHGAGAGSVAAPDQSGSVPPLKFLRQIVDILEEEKPDLIHLHASPSPDIWYVDRLLRKASYSVRHYDARRFGAPRPYWSSAYLLLTADALTAVHTRWSIRARFQQSPEIVDCDTERGSKKSLERPQDGNVAENHLRRTP